MTDEERLELERLAEDLARKAQAKAEASKRKPKAANGEAPLEPSPPVEEHPEQLEEPFPLEYTESELAYAFSARWAAELVFVPQWGKWMRWEGGRWREDHTVKVFDSARRLLRQKADRAIATEPRGLGIAKALGKAQTVAAIERLCRHHEPHIRETRQFDALRNALNTPAGKLGLSDGLTAPADPTDYLTRLCATSPAAEADCPIWQNFLLQVMSDDPDMVGYLQKVCGYILTGLLSEHKIFFFYGTGFNGKSTFLRVLVEILGLDADGGYAAVAPMTTFMETSFEHHSTDLAMMRGTRLVVAYEVEEGHSWAIGKIKMMTGEDPITARFMRQDFFTYWPQFSIVVVGNHKPNLGNVDYAIKERFDLVPFLRRFAPQERDKGLPGKLRGEYPGIFRWMIQGAIRWHREGLQSPDKVRLATDAYIADEDNIAAWMRECCLSGASYYDTLINLYASYKAWVEAGGVRAKPRKDFAKLLDAREGLQRKEEAETGRAGWNGIAVKPRDIIA